ncbi:c-type cytochrome [Flavobacterium litorale]|uniref:Cytochrome c n=1 Tax=Flavobacterium litorale TaxID=2856519 RepID=A0ABX8V7C3_9FLAO|nr:c-type cytochrome [Flavobacterium litorale]QYJ68737.1 cytochrome c [Flavobacterium litorale]
MIKLRNILLTGLLVALCSCESNTFEDIEADVIQDGEITYNDNVKAIIDNNCISCHAPGGVASFTPLTTYTEVRFAVENKGLLNRIQRQNGEDGQMPPMGRMPMNNIDQILQWAENGLPEN